MAKKLNKDELNNVSGGCGGDNGNTKNNSSANQTIFYNCDNESCKKRVNHNDAIIKDNMIYCPYCGSYLGKIE